ncbi:MAG: hypothetical protein IKC08_05535, partial [Lentisphaeria bacterium]|nr:hypothetical protein [Lentisphaeria bacterium]
SGYSLENTTVEWGRAEVLKEGKDLLIWAMGKECKTALQIAENLKEKNIECTVVNGRFYKPFDKELFLACAEKMPVVTIEDAVAGTGVDAITDSLLVNRKYPFFIQHFSWQSDTVIPHGTIDGIRKKAGFTAEKMTEKILEKMQKKNG